MEVGLAIEDRFLRPAPGLGPAAVPPPQARCRECGEPVSDVELLDNDGCHAACALTRLCVGND